MYFPTPRGAPPPFVFFLYFLKKEKLGEETKGDGGRQRGERFINLYVLSPMAQLGQNKPAGAGGAVGGQARQQNMAPVCRALERVIADMRADIYLAVRLDELVRWVNDELEASGSEVKATADDVKECLRYDNTIKIVKTKSTEVIWLWELWRYYELIEKVADMAARYRAVLADPENPEYDDDCGVLGCDKGDDDAQMKYLEE